MRYIKLYEAFTSNTISKLYGFLKRNGVSVNEFRDYLVNIMSNFDIPLSEITDQDVDYLSTINSLKIKSENPVDNKFGIFALKFFFDKDGKYHGVCMTGNVDFTPKKTDFYKDPKYFKILQDVYGLSNNTDFYPIENFKTLKIGDSVVSILGDEFDEFEPTYGRIYIENGYYFIIHSDEEHEGSKPNEMPSGDKWGKFSWKLGKNSTDYKKLCLVSEDGLENDYSYFNLNFNFRKLCLEEWESPKRMEKIKDSDFSVVIYLDDIIKRSLKKPSVLKKERSDLRLGATALMSDKDFKKINFDKYINLIINNFGVTSEIVELKNIGRAVSKIMCCSYPNESYSLMALMTNDFYNLDEFIQLLVRVFSINLDFVDENLKENLYKSFVSDFKDLKESTDISVSNKKIIMKEFSEYDGIKPLYDTLVRIGDKIGRGINSENIKKGFDIKKLYLKLNSIRDMIKDKNYGVSDELLSFFKKSGVEYNISPYFCQSNILSVLTKDYIEKYMSDDIEKLNDIESYVDEIF
jgi:hypothetical protein